VVDGEEDARVARALDDAAERGRLLLGRSFRSGLPEARDPDGAEAGVLELSERLGVVPNAVVYGSNQKRGASTVVATAAGKGRGGEETRTTKGVPTRSTGRPGRAASTKAIESSCHPGVSAAAGSRTFVSRPAGALPVVTASSDRRGRRSSRAR
jgi:hypothetical protein